MIKWCMADSIALRFSLLELASGRSSVRAHLEMRGNTKVAAL